ncbi:hypothetical protein PULV_a3043 [Pseudoalteromonas ulvae UL12]|uniref:YegP family protein n=1 Tax=Pseudoalteromonas ulvae TaxID=107327 RepID=UPI00186BB1D8|nr:YegP family protein [Pseudoalteromonas ulvae]MBE0362413.1 hypothetical protein [Pseudoalteromonas ulvae UL12]
MKAKFQLFKSTKKNQFYFRLLATNNQIILASEGYATKANGKNGITSVKVHSPHDNFYQRLNASNRQYYFTLTAANNQVIGVSELYVSTKGRENGIASVKQNAQTAGIEDLTVEYAGA